MSRAGGPETTEAPEVPAPPRRRFTIGRFTARALLWVSAGLVVLGFVLLRTALGHRTLLEWGLDRVRANVAGSIEVGEIRSANLLRGARLLDVRLLTPEGDTFVVADSVEASYSVRGLIAGDLRLGGVHVWGGRFDFARATPATPSTMGAWSARPASPDTAAPAGPPERAGFGGFTASGIRLTEASFRLRLPTDRDPGGLVRVDTTGGRRLALDVQVEDARVPLLRIGGRDEASRIDVAQASARVDVLSESLFVDRLEAGVTVADGQVAVELADLLMPEGRTEGTVAVSLESGSEALVDLVLAIEDLDTRDLAWLSPDLPPLTGRTRLVGQVRRGGSRWTADGAELDWDGADVRGGGTVVMTGGVSRLQGVELRTSGVAVEDLERWLPESLHLGGRVGGRVALDGAPSRMRVEGELTWTTPLSQPVVFRGGGGVTGVGRGSLGFDEFSAILGPFEWSALRQSAGLPLPLDGPGYLDLTLAGSLSNGLDISGEARHLGSSDGAPASRMLVDGTLRTRDGLLAMDLAADLSPLALEIFRAVPDSGETRPLGLEGAVSGSIRVVGDTESLRVVADVGDGVGDLEFEAGFSPRDVSSAWSVEGVAAGLSGELFAALGPETSLTGTVTATGSGFTPANADITVVGELESSRLSGVHVDSLAMRSRLAGGVLSFDLLQGFVGGFALEAEGTLAVSDSARPGTVQATFETESLLGIRSTFLGDSVLARPESGLARRVLEAAGIDPDTLPRPEEVEWDGVVRGQATLTGSIESFDLVGNVSASGVQIGPHLVDSLAIFADGVDLPGDALRVGVEITADSLLVFDRAYSSAALSGALGRTSGSFTLEVGRGEEEAYAGRGGYEIDGPRRRLRFDELTARFDSLGYQLQRPATVAWGDSALTVEDVEVRRLGPDPAIIRADGRLPTRGPVDFTLSAEGLYLERLTRVLQREEIDVAGRVDLEATVAGQASAPTIQASLRADSLRWRRLEVDGLDGRIDYGDRVSEIEVQANREGRVVLEVEGEIPIDLSLVPGTSRFYDREMYLVARATGLPAGATVATLEDLEDVEGSVSGRLEIAGTPEDPRTSGSLRLDGGAWTVGSLGVRHVDVSGTAVLGEDNVLTVDATGTSGGTVDVDGSITFASLTDPVFDLDFEFEDFRGVDRRDILGVFSGTAQLTETYRSPRIEGRLVVDQGTIFLDEFVRNAQVVDLTSSRLAGLVGGESGTRLLQIEGNPFLTGLFTEIHLSAPSNTRLQGRDLDIELAGDVQMVFDRRARDIVLVGDLNARRGSYRSLGRTFQVQGGAIQFIGTPGVNPELKITASTRVRRQEFGDLTVNANVVGSLTEPRVVFSTDEEALGESDIIAYLLTGQPSTGITSGSSSDAGALALGTGVSLAAGSIISQIGAFAAQQTDIIDYLSVTGVSDAAASSLLGGPSTFGNARVEVGRYFAGGDIFGALVLRAADLRTQPLGGARIEWQSTDQFHVEAFFEDRFLRIASVGLAELGAGSAYSFGFALVREWGY